MVVLVDCNNFYVSCERLFNPAMNLCPVVVLSNNDGCVVSRSIEAKKIGIPMGIPVHKIKEDIKKYKIAVFSSNYTLYGDISQRIMNELKKISPKVEVYSIDEAFVDLSHISNDNLENVGAEIVALIKKNIGMPVSAGIAPTKTLAKVATEIAKKYPQLNSTYCINSEERRIKALKWLPIEDVWGIGRRNAAKLKLRGVFKAFDFTKLDDLWVKKNMTVEGLRLKSELCGISAIELSSIEEVRKSISKSSSFAKLVTKYIDIEQAICTYIQIIAEKLRNQKSHTHILAVHISTNRNRIQDKQYSNTKFINLPTPTNSSIELVKFAKQALKLIFREGYNYKKAGVIATGLVTSENQQLSLFDTVDRGKHTKLMDYVDKINLKGGNSMVKLASSMGNNRFKMKQESLSKRFTTDWDNLIEINVDKNE